MTTENEIIEGQVLDTETEQAEPVQIGDITDLVLVVNAQVVESNFAMVAEQIKTQISQISEKLETEQDFLNAAQVAKNLRAAKKQISDRRDQVLKDAEELYAELSLFESVEVECTEKAIALESLVKAEKKRKRETMVDQSYASCERHYDAYVDDWPDFRLARPSIALFNWDDYQDVIKGCSSFTSMQKRLDDQAKAIKAAIDDAFKKVIDNAKAIDAAGHKQLFIDRKALLLLEPEHLQSEVQGRVARHEAEEVKKQAEADRIKREADEKAEADRLAQELIDNEAAELAAQNANESYDEQAEPTPQAAPIDDGIPDTLPEIELEHTELTGVSLTDNEPAQTTDNRPLFGDGPAVGSPVPVVKISDQKPAEVAKSAPTTDDSVRTLEIVMSVTASLERAKQIANIAHGRFKNMPETSDVSLRDPNKKFNAMTDELVKRGFRVAAKTLIDIREGN